MANSLDDVLDASLRVLDSYGLEFLSMRRVAAELDIQPSALYHHVANKQSLLALMADRIVGEVVVEPIGPWDERVTTACHELRSAMLAVRDGAEVVATASAFRLGVSSIESQLTDALIETKLLDGADRDAARALLLYTFSHAQASQLHAQASSLGAIVASPELFSRASFDFGLRLIIAGIAAEQA